MILGCGFVTGEGPVRAST